jgi:hypothetical protein
MSKVLTIAVASVLALGLVLGIALPGVADSEEAPLWADDFQARIVKGKVIDVNIDEEGQGYFDIQSGEDELTIKVNENTKYFKLCVPGRIVSLARHWMQFRLQNQEELGAPGGQGRGLGFQKQVRARALARNQMRLQNQTPPLDSGDLAELNPPKLKWFHPFGEESEFSDIAVGDRVVMWAEENSELLAKRVLIIKPITYASVSGTIDDVSLEDENIAITPDDGEAVTLTYNENTVFILNGFIAVEEGQYAHVIYDSDNMLAKRVTVSLAGD